MIMGEAKTKYGFRLKERRQKQTCMVAGCSGKTAVNGKWCELHREVIRGFQVTLGNMQHRRKLAVQRGQKEVRHRVLHEGKPTAWALQNPSEAIRMVLNREAPHTVGELTRAFEAEGIKLVVTTMRLKTPPAREPKVTLSVEGEDEVEDVDDPTN